MVIESSAMNVEGVSDEGMVEKCMLRWMVDARRSLNTLKGNDEDLQKMAGIVSRVRLELPLIKLPYLPAQRSSIRDQDCSPSQQYIPIPMGLSI